MPDIASVSDTLITGHFRLVTPAVEIERGYQDDREVGIVYKTGCGEQACRAVLRLSRDMPYAGVVGHTTNPEGFNVYIYEKGDQTMIEISRRERCN